MSKGHFATGQITGTGAALNVLLGFVPTYVKIINQTDVGSLEWIGGMPAASGLKTTDAPSEAFITSDGISEYAGTIGADAAGFTLGADADINGSGDQLHFVAWREDH